MRLLIFLDIQAPVGTADSRTERTVKVPIRVPERTWTLFETVETVHSKKGEMRLVDEKASGESSYLFLFDSLPE